MGASGDGAQSTAVISVEEELHSCCCLLPCPPECSRNRSASKTQSDSHSSSSSSLSALHAVLLGNNPFLIGHLEKQPWRVWKQKSKLDKWDSFLGLLAQQLGSSSLQLHHTAAVELNELGLPPPKKQSRWHTDSNKCAVVQTDFCPTIWSSVCVSICPVTDLSLELSLLCLFYFNVSTFFDESSNSSIFFF